MTNMTPKYCRQTIQFFLAVLIGVCLPGREAAATPSSQGGGENRALGILRRASAYLTQAERFRFTSDTVYVINPTADQPIEFRARQDLSIKRPNRAVGTVHRQDESTRRVWYDGKTLTVLEEPDQVYSTLAVPETIDATLDYLKAHEFALFPLVNLLYSDLSFLERQAEAWRYVGEEPGGPVRCHRLAFQGPESAGEVWIESGATPLFRKAVVRYAQQEGQPRFTAQFDHWEIGLDLPDTQFLFTAPEGAQQMSLTALAPPQAPPEQAGPDE